MIDRGVWQGACMGGGHVVGTCMAGACVVGGVHGKEACMTRGHAWVGGMCGGSMHGRGYVVGGVHGRGLHGRGHA